MTMKTGHVEVLPLLHNLEKRQVQTIIYTSVSHVAGPQVNISPGVSHAHSSASVVPQNRPKKPELAERLATLSLQNWH